MDCNLLFEQIPSSTLNLYMSDPSEEPLSNALLMKPGDKITFVWDVATTFKADIVNKQDTFVAANAASYGTGQEGAQETVPGQYAGNTVTHANLGIAPVRVAITMTLDGTKTDRDVASRFPIAGINGAPASGVDNSSKKPIALRRAVLA